jgi:hypothetical protein
LRCGRRLVLDVLGKGGLGRETQSSRQNESALQKLARFSFPET